MIWALRGLAAAFLFTGLRLSSQLIDQGIFGMDLGRAVVSLMIAGGILYFTEAEYQ